MEGASLVGVFAWNMNHHGVVHIPLFIPCMDLQMQCIKKSQIYVVCEPLHERSLALQNCIDTNRSDMTSHSQGDADTRCCHPQMERVMQVSCPSISVAVVAM